MFIVQRKESTNKTIRMPNDLIDQLEDLAGSENISFNQLVVQCCEYALQHISSNDGKISDTESFLKRKRFYKTAFIEYMTDRSSGNEKTLSQIFTDAIFLTKTYNADLDIDFYDLLVGNVSISEYEDALVSYFTNTKKKSPIELAKSYVRAFELLQAFMRDSDYLSEEIKNG